MDYRMFSSQIINHPINGNGTVEYQKGFKYTGEWKNGRKIGEGVLEKDSVTLKVKIREGNIYKGLQVLNFPFFNNSSATCFPIPPIRVIEVGGGNYKEEYSENQSDQFLISRKKIFFDGKAYPIKKIFIRESYSASLIKADLNDSNSFRSIIEISHPGFKAIGYSINFTFNGNCKLIAEDCIFKGDLKGHYFKGPLNIKMSNYKIIFDIYLNIIKPPIKVRSKNIIIDLFPPNNQDEIYKIKYINSKKLSDYEFAEIIDKIQTLCMNLKKFTYSFSLTQRLLSSVLSVDKNWKLFEEEIQNEENTFDCLFGKNQKFVGKDEKCFKILDYNERYEGRIWKGKFEGIGKFFYKDGSVYAGEFKNNLRNGLGTLRFKDGRVYRGYWVNGMMQGKGRLINSKFKISGVWERNKLQDDKLCIFLNYLNKI